MSGAKTVIFTLVIQGAITLFAALIGLFVANSTAAISAFLGGGIHCIATALSGMQHFSARPGATPTKMLQAFLFAELIKITMTVTLLMFVLQLETLSLPPLILTFIAVAMLAPWLALLLTASR